MAKTEKPHHSFIACNNCGMPKTRFHLNLVLLAHPKKGVELHELVCDPCFKKIPKVAK